MVNWLERTELLLGEDKLNILKNANVLVVGVGGVGAYAAEMIVRSGVGRMTIADADKVSPTNINRQLVALHSTVGREKCDILADRLKDINPELQLTIVNRFIKDDETDALLDSSNFDYVVDAIDTLSPKLALINGALDRGIRIVSSMGAGAKTDPTLMEIKDIAKTHHCPSQNHAQSHAAHTHRNPQPKLFLLDLLVHVDQTNGNEEGPQYILMDGVENTAAHHQIKGDL